MSTLGATGPHRPAEKKSPRIALTRIWAACLIGATPLVVAPIPASATSQPRAMGGVKCSGTISGGATSGPTGPRLAKVRVANFYLNANGTPGATLDLYDTPTPSKAEKPLISGLAYGQVSSYVSPRAEGPESLFVGNDYGSLFMFEHGCKTNGGTVDGEQPGSAIVQTGWLKGQQETVVMGDGFDGPQTSPSTLSIHEVEPPHQGQTYVLKPPAGKGMLIVNDFGLVENTPKVPGVELRIDGHCANSILTGGPPASPNPGAFEAFIFQNTGDFPLSPGAHTVNLVADPAPGAALNLQQCNAAPQRTYTKVKISPSAPVMLFVYGSDPYHAKVVVTGIG
jgi:hypothetical protein